MSGISISKGLISGLDFDALATSLISRRQGEIDRLEANVTVFEAKKTATSVLEARVLSLTASATALSNESTFSNLRVSNPAQESLKVTTADGAVEGTYKFQSVQRASAHQSISRGYANTEQKPGVGTLVIAQGGKLNQGTLLETLNDGSGVRRGSFRITDRSGQAAVIDVSDALTVDDVLNQINDNVDISITASTSNGSLVLTDTSGSTSTSLSIVDLNGGNTASDLGIAGSASGDALTGSSIYEITGGFTLDQINDGNGLKRLSGAPDIKITLTDATELEINLDDAITLNDVVQAINSHEDNEGKLTAEVTNGRIVLTDSAAGGDTLTIEDINSSKVVRQLGLDTTVIGNVLTGNSLGGGLNSSLLRNLNGGTGISEQGSIEVTDRSGKTATLDFSNAESLEDILFAINNAVEDGTTDLLSLKASVNSVGTGIIIEDTSGATASNLVIADVATGTVAADLNIAIDSSETTVESGTLNLRYVNESTSVSKYVSEGESLSTGEIQITDTDGNVGIIDISSSVQTVGDVISRINSNSSISVTAQLNETGDGFVLIDEAGGAGELKVEEFSGGSVAKDLKLLGDFTTGTDGKQRISSRVATVIEIGEDDTVTDIVSKINEQSSIVGASLFDDGSQFNSTRLSLSSKETGAAGSLFIDDGGLNLDFGTVIQGADAVLKMGDNPSSAFLLVSQSNTFKDVVTGISVELLDTSDSIAEVVVQKDTSSIQKNIESLVASFNQLISTADELTQFNSETNQGGILQGESFILRLTSRINRTMSKQTGDINANVRSLGDLGIRPDSKGKLTIDAPKLILALIEDPSAVESFFLDEDTGFGEILKDTLKSFTDTVDGSFAIENQSLDRSVSGIKERVEDLTILMEAKRDRILLNFIKMESAIGALQSQQEALTAFKPVGSTTSK